MLTALNEALPGTKGDNLAGSWSSRIIHTAISKHLHFSSSFKCQALTHLAFYVLMCLSEAILQLNSCSGWVVKKKKKKLLSVSFHWSSSSYPRTCSWKGAGFLSLDVSRGVNQGVQVTSWGLICAQKGSWHSDFGVHPGLCGFSLTAERWNGRITVGRNHGGDLQTHPEPWQGHHTVPGCSINQNNLVFSEIKSGTLTL